MQQIKEKIKAFVWPQVRLRTYPLWRRTLVRWLQIIHVVILDALEGPLTLQAMSLVYTTLLSLVPLLAVSFSVLKAFGVHNQIEPLLANFLAPLGVKGVEITGRIIGFVDNMRTGVLGSLSLLMLFYTVVSLIQKIETAFNSMWRVPQSRSISQRFSDYLSVILLGPVLIVSALGMTATVVNSEWMQWIATIEPFGTLLDAAAHFMPSLLVIAAFTLVYVLVPNTHVNFGSALIGAVVAGTLWETMGWMFAAFVVNSAQFTAIYSAFATLIVFLIWLYISWVIVLLGSDLAFYHQYPGRLTHHRQAMRMSNRMKERIALHAMTLIGQNWYGEKPNWSINALAREMQLPLESLVYLMGILKEADMVRYSDDHLPVILPGTPLEQLTAGRVIQAVRTAEESPVLSPSALAPNDAVEALWSRLEKSLADQLDSTTVKDLALFDAASKIPVASTATPVEQPKENRCV